MPGKLSQSSFARAFVVALVILATPQMSGAQGVQRIDAAKPSCSGCTLVFTKIATLGSINDDEFPGLGERGSGMAVDSKGRFYVTSMSGDQVLVYERSGKFARTIGRKGGGPGEFERAMKVVIDAVDSVHVLDNRRISTFSPAFKFVRSIPLPVRPTTGIFVNLTNGRVAVAFAVGGRSGALPFSVFAPTGAEKSFGKRDTSTLHCNACSLLTLGPGTAADQFWSLAPNAYEFEEWRADGQLLRRISVVGSSWFLPWSGNAAMGNGLPPVSMTDNVYTDKIGLVWIEGRSAAPGWKPLPPIPPKPNTPKTRGAIPIGGVLPRPEAIKQLITNIDIIDPKTNHLVLSYHVTGRALRLISSELVGEIREDDDAVPVWDIYRVAIKRP